MTVSTPSTQQALPVRPNRPKIGQRARFLMVVKTHRSPSMKYGVGALTHRVP
jgi:hypothetical protein